MSVVEDYYRRQIALADFADLNKSSTIPSERPPRIPFDPPMPSKSTLPPEASSIPSDDEKKQKPFIPYFDVDF
jgi:hypothetical protein